MATNAMKFFKDHYLQESLLLSLTKKYGRNIKTMILKYGYGTAIAMVNSLPKNVAEYTMQSRI